MNAIDLGALARAAYWLATLYRRGESIPDGIGHDAAAEAAATVRRLGIRPDSTPAYWPIAGRHKIAIRLETAEAALDAAEYLRACGLTVTFREDTLIEGARG